MSLKTDCCGTALTSDIKVCNPNTTWNTRLKPYRKNDIIICTFSVSDVMYISKLLERHEGHVTIICHDKYSLKAIYLKNQFPHIDIFTNPHAHSKMILIEPGVVWLSSENIGRISKNFDSAVAIDNEFVYDFYFKQIQNLIASRETMEVTI